jgi:hypothetical protein
MSVFGSIMSKIFGHHAAAAPGGAPAVPAASPAAPSGTPAPATLGASAPAQPAAAASATAPATPPPVAQSVDVEAVLTDLAGKNSQPLNWRTSIVDLMKLLNLDSSLANRKELATELNYTGDAGDSATMNVWLHKQVMQKLAENGCKVPIDLVA